MDILLTPSQRAEVLIPTASPGTITLNSTTLLSLEVQGSNSKVRALPLVINPSPTSVPNAINKTLSTTALMPRHN